MTPADAEAAAGPIHTTAAKISERLQAVFPPNRFQHELLPAPLTMASLAKLSSAKCPLVGLAFLGIKPKPANGRTLDGTLRWAAYLVTKNPKSAPRLLGDALAPGLAQMMHAAALGLHGWTVGGTGPGGAGTLTLGDAENIDGNSWNEDQMAAAVLTLEVQAKFTAAVPDELLALATSWRFDTDPAAESAADTWSRPV